MDEKLYKIKKGSEFDFYSTESSGTINKIVGKTTQETEIAPLITVNEFSQLELDRDDTMRKVSIDPTSDDITQKTREGYNLVDFKSPDEIYVSDFNFQNDILTIASPSGSFRQIVYDITNLMLANAGKVLSFWYSNIDFSQGKSPAVQITLTKNDNTKSYTQLLSASLVKSNFNIPDNILEYSSLKLGVLCNNTSESSNASITITKPMLLIGTEEKPYEEYGASPSLDYPSEFKNIERELSIINNQENYFNTTQIANKDFSNSGLTVTTDENGIFTVDGTHSGQVNIDFNNLNFNIKENQVIKFILLGGNVNYQGNILNCINLILWNKDWKSLALLNINNSLIISSDTVKYFQVRFIIPRQQSSITYTNFKFGIMVVDDESIENYVPYNGYSEKVTLPENNFLGAFNGYKNHIKDSKLKSNLKIITLDGTEKYTIQSTETNTIRFKLDLSLDTNVVLDNTNLNYLCNYLKAYKYNESTEDKEGIFIGATTSSIEIYMRVPLNEIASIDDFKEFLSSKAITEEPFKILLQCGEEEISLEDINLPLYNGTNNIFAENSNISFYPYADMPSLERPSPIESISGDYTINIHGENFLQDQYNTTDLSQYNWCFHIKANLKPDTTYTISLIGAIDNKYYVSEQLAVGGGSSFAFTMTGERQSITFTTKSDISGAWNTSLQMYNIFKNAKAQPHEHIFKDVMLVEGNEAKDYIPYISSNTVIELPEGVELNKLNLEDYIKQDGTITVNNKRITFDGTENWSFNTEVNRFDIYNLPISILDVPQTERKQLCTHFKTYNPYANSQGSFSVGNSYIRIYNDNNMTLEEWKTYLAQQNEAGTPVEIVYTSGEPTKSVLPTTEVTKMQLFPVIIGENHLVAPSEMVLLYYDEREEEENIQPITITNEGKLLPFNLLVDYNKTDLPLIAEAIEASQTITGADGDLVLDTTYGSRLFEIDAVTDDFLTPEQKEAKREEIREFLNSIKKVNTKLIIEPQNRTYEVKYAGLAEDTNLPKCVEFLIPLKSASAYAISNTTYTLEGEGEIESETKAPAGFVCTISGPSNYPELALNGYLMAYENVILEGEKLIIDTKKSTVTKISTTGVKTNAMVYYNHQFPRIQEGLNLFTIISGIDEDKLKIEWNDLLL